MRTGAPTQSACQTGKRRRRYPLLAIGGLKRSPSRQRFWEHLGINGHHFWIALTPFSTRRVRLASAEGALPRYLGDWGGAPAANAFGEYLGVNGTHFWIALTPFSTWRVRLASAKGALLRYWGLGWSPSRQRFWEHLGVNGTHFWIALTPFSIILAPTAGLQPAVPIVIVPFGNSRHGRRRQWYWRLTHIGGIGHVHQNVRLYMLSLHRGAKMYRGAKTVG